MKKLLIIAAVGEAATGLGLLIIPSVVGQLLLGEVLSGIAIPVGRVAGIALIALVLACWPDRKSRHSTSRALGAMLSYNLLVTLYLFYLGSRGEWAGILLWPAVIFHAILSVLLTGAWVKTEREKKESG